MTNKELRKLSRTELLEVLITQSKEIERLTALLDDANRQLENRRIDVEDAGDLAMASMKLNQVFDSAQKAADLYLTNVREMSVSCEKMEQETREKCDKMLEKARAEARRYLDEINMKLSVMSARDDDLRLILGTVEPLRVE